MADKYHMGCTTPPAADRSAARSHRSGLQASNPSELESPAESRCLQGFRPGRREFLLLLPLLAFGLVLGRARPCLAQATAGTILGRVLDARGGVVPKATGTVQNGATGMTQMAETSTAGEYSVPALPPGLGNIDLSALKEIPLRERIGLQLRFEFFNLTNTAHFANPGGDMASGSFGGITQTAGNPRIVQFAVKAVF